MIFIDREEELSFLEERYKTPRAEFIVLYGRRRIGKSELIKQFTKNKSAIYSLSTKTTSYHQLKAFLNRISLFFNEYPPEIDSWEECFRYISQKLEKTKEKLILVIDEFSYLIESNKEIPSLFQLFWDEYLKEKNVFLILCGSLISMMESEVLGKKSPLYGRRTGQIKLPPLRFKEVMKFYPNLSIKEVIEFYAVLGNIPMYLWEFDQDKTLLANILEKILAKKGLLNEEAEFLLKEELRDPATYQAILEAISRSAKASEIAQKAHLELHNLDKYLKTLLRLDLIYKETPITSSPKSKKVYYHIKDNFLDFWYQFCFLNLSLIEENPAHLLEKIIAPSLNNHLGKKFEKIAYEFLWELNRQNKSPFAFTKLGREWGTIPYAPKDQNQYEIDLVALNPKAKEILFAECKWSDDVEAEEVLKELKEKAKYVNWFNNERKEYYAVFARSFKSKPKLENLYLFDLKDVEKLFKPESSFFSLFKS